MRKVTGVASSPFHPVTYRYDLTDPYEEPALFYFRAEGAPEGWQVKLTPRKILLNPGEHMLGQATITPPKDAEVCTSERVQVTSWIPRGDTMINVGGGIVQVDLNRSTAITLDAGGERCQGEDWEQLYKEAEERGEPIDPDLIQKYCGRITATGCTVPSLPGQEVIVRFTGLGGDVEYHTVKTDEHGCFEDFVVTVDQGIWCVDVEYEGDECQAPATGGPRFVCFCL